MSTVPNRKLIVKPLHLGPYTKAVILPAWWLKLNDNPDSIEMSLTLDFLMIRPIREEENDDPEHPNARQNEP